MPKRIGFLYEKVLTLQNCTAAVLEGTANLKKTVDAAMKSIEDIRYLREKGALAHMSPALRRAAEARLANPQASLTELGELMNPPVGRSGVNHRLRRLTEMAEELRAKEGQEQP